MTDYSATQTRLEEAMSEWARRVEAGLPVEKQSFVAGYPDVADELARAIEFETRLGQACWQMGGTPPVSSLPSGSVFGDFVIVREVGRGGMGVVYETRQVSLSRRVALKLLSSALGASPRERARFFAEARIVALLDHANIVDVYDAGEHEGIPYFAMQFIEGESLAQMLAREREEPSADEAAYVRRIAEYGAQAAEGLAEAHARGVIHRDIKPSNLLVDGDRLWITDFGLARARDLTEAQSSHRPVGTVRYMSPEQFAGTAVAFDGRSDVYSLGVTLFELLTGEHPGVSWSREEAPSLRQHRPGIPVDLDTIVRKAMASETEERYANASELAVDLRRWLRGEPVKARPLTRVQRVRRVLWRRRHVVGAIALALMVGLVIAGVTLWRAYRTEVALREELEGQRQLTLDTVRELTRMVAKHVRHEPGKAAEEIAVIEKALRLAEQAAEHAPPEHELHEEVAMLTSRLFRLEMRLWNHQRAEEFLGIAEKRLRTLIERYPDRDAVRNELVLLILHLGPISGRYPSNEEASARLHEGLDHLNVLLHREPRKPEYLERKVQLLMRWAGHLLNTLGRVDEAREKAQQALAISEDLRQRFPQGHPLSYSRLVGVWMMLARCHEELKQDEEARQAYRRAHECDQHLAREYPGRYTMREDTIRLAYPYVQFLRRRGLEREAADVLSQAVAELSQALEIHSNFPPFRFGLLECSYLQGMLAYERRDDAEARRAFAKVVETYRFVIEEPARDGHWLLKMLAMPFVDLMHLEEWSKRIESIPASDPQRQLLHGLLALRRDEEQARLLLENVCAVPEANQTVARFGLAILHARKKEWAEARVRLAEGERLLRRDAGDGEHLLHLVARRMMEGR